jgi:phage I-like protein
MTPEQIREAIGLKPEASEIEVAAKLAALGLIPKAADPAPAVEPVVEPVVAPVAVAEPKVDDDDILKHPVVAELRTSLADLTARLEQREQNEKEVEADLFIKDAVAAGKLKPAEAPKFKELFATAPDVTREIIQARARGSEVPVTVIGHSANPEGDLANADFEAAIPDPGKGF